MMQKGAAAGVREMTALVAQVAQFGSLIDTSQMSTAEVEELRANVRSVVADGEQTRSQLLEHVHRTARPGVTPDQLALSRAVADYRALVASFPRA